jgi:hypothetical protein
MRIWMGTLAVTALVVGYLAFAPTGDASYSCVDAPIVRVFSPEPETNDSQFFDSGAQCNADASTRARLVALALAAGAAFTGAAVAHGRRQRRATASQSTAAPDLPVA